jgi:hypothetical protein
VYKRQALHFGSSFEGLSGAESRRMGLGVAVALGVLDLSRRTGILGAWLAGVEPCTIIVQNRKVVNIMATSSKKVVVTGDDINPTIGKAFAGVVGGSLEGELKVWLEGVSLMARGVVTVRGMKATLEDTFEKVGVLPTLTTSSVQYWGKAHALYTLEGGKAKSLKELLRLAREVSSANNGKDGAPTFAKAIEGKTLDAVRKATPTQGAQKKKAHHKGEKVSTVKVSAEELAQTLIKALAKGAKISDATLESLADALNALMVEDIAA